MHAPSSCDIPKKLQGFTLVELLITIALSSVLLLALISYLSSLMKSAQQQEDSNALYHQALLISQLWQKELAYTADLGCQIFDQPSQISQIDSGAIYTHSGLIIYQVGRDFLPSVLAHTIQKKLLPHSVVVVAEGIQSPVTAYYSAQNKKFSLSTAAFQKNDLALLSSCHQAWLFHWPHTASTQFIPPFNITEPGASYQVALWHTTLWFAMQDNQKRYGIYRLMLPNETTPEELISDVRAFQAYAWLGDQRIPATADVDWQQVNSIQLILTLEKNHFSVYWPTNIALLRKAQSWKTI